MASLLHSRLDWPCCDCDWRQHWTWVRYCAWACEKGCGRVVSTELLRVPSYISWVANCVPCYSMLCRQESRALAAIEKIKSELGPDTKSKIEFIKFDLQNLKSATKAAQDFMERETRLGMYLAWRSTYFISQGLMVYFEIYWLTTLGL